MNIEHKKWKESVGLGVTVENNKRWLIRLIITIYWLCVEYLSQHAKNTDNTFPPNATGNPALTINAGFSSSEPHLPIGMMLIGRHFEESMVLRVAHAYESLRNASPDYSDMEKRLRAAMKSHSQKRYWAVDCGRCATWAIR